jgi:hypothetical protein
MHIIVFVFLNFLSTSLFANENWYHIPLRSQDGTSIVLDYQFINGSYEPHHQQLYHFIDNLWINVYPNEIGLLKENDNLIAVFRIYRTQKLPNFADNWVLDSTLNVVLYWNGRNFTGQLKGIDQLGYYTTRFPIYSFGAFGEYEYREEITFSVSTGDKQFSLIDPVNHSPYFKVDLYQKVLEQGLQ